MHLGTWEMSVPTVTSPQSPPSHEGAAGPKTDKQGVGTPGGGPGPANRHPAGQEMGKASCWECGGLSGPLAVCSRSRKPHTAFIFFEFRSFMGQNKIQVQSYRMEPEEEV